jgi:hypothetical protein
MSLSFFIYLTDIIPEIGFTAGLISLFMSIVAIGSTIGYWATWFEETKDIEFKEKSLYFFRRSSYISFSIASICIIISLLAPSQKTMYMILAAYGVENIAANEQVQATASKSLMLIEKTISEYLEKDTLTNTNESKKE